MDIGKKMGICVLLGVISLTTNAQVNSFEEAYSTSMLDDNFCSRWSFYANTPMSERMKKRLPHVIFPKLPAEVYLLLGSF